MHALTTEGYYYREGEPGSVIHADEHGDTLIGDLRCVVLDEASSIEEAETIAAEWAAQCSPSARDE